MAITTLNSASSLFEGSDSAELVRIETGGAAFSTVKAAGGSDTITLLSAAAGTALYVDANAGADVVTFSGTITESTILGGAGGDTITISTGAATFTDGLIKAGDGNDNLIVSALDLSGTTFNLGAGSDTLNFSGAGGVTGASFQAGAGNDTINLGATLNFSSTTVIGGGGADDIVISGDVAGESLINGDSSVNGGGSDTIVIDHTDGTIALVSSTIKGKGGSDQITIQEGTIGASARIEGNAGADAITLSDLIAANNAFIGGGSGNDTISFTGTVAGASGATVMGGGGADSISLLGNDAGASHNGGVKLYGGAGADTIELGGEATGITIGANATGIIGLNSLSDSNLDSIDKISGTVQLSGLNFALDTAAGITSFTIGVYNDSDATTPSITAGVASGGSWQSADSTLTARTEQLDDLMSTKGTIVGYTAGGEDYLFIQGGSEGTDDDAVIEVSEALSGGFNVATDYQFYVGFGG